jgi:hypothetical protein
VITWVIVLLVQGYIPSSLAVLALLLIPVILALGRGFGGSVGRTVRFLFRIGLPIASLATSVFILSGGSFKEIGILMGYILVLFLMVIGFYVMFYGVFSRHRH